MNWRVVSVGLLLPLAGCTLAETANRNLYHEPKQVADDHKLDHRLRSEARRVLAEVAAAHPRKVFCPEFRDGFVDGFADYLDSGGPCVPPPIPPLKYRTIHYLTPDGHARIRDYFAGFKYGVEVAVATGMRAYLTVPVLLAEPPPPPPLNVTLLPAPPDGLSTDPKVGPTGPAAPAAAGAVTPVPTDKAKDPPQMPPAEKPNDPGRSSALPPVPIPTVPVSVPVPAGPPLTAVIDAPVPIPVVVRPPTDAMPRVTLPAADPTPLTADGRKNP